MPQTPIEAAIQARTLGRGLESTSMYVGGKRKMCLESRSLLWAVSRSSKCLTGAAEMIETVQPDVGSFAEI
ncbi:hypothetical protein IG631_23554 [Alternaria alternata]|nr:hypothetical protein IG631_23554 [Alternaria alternata]